MIQVLFVINNKAGKKSVNREEQIREFCRHHPVKPSFFHLSPSSFVALEGVVQNFPGEVVAAVGGDGTVSLLAELLSNTNKMLAIIPAGSANGMARELNIPTDPLKAMEILLSGKPYSIDAIRINKNLTCIHLSDLGLNAQLVKYFEHGNLRGKLGYAKMVLKTLWYKQKMYVKLQSGGRTIERQAFMVVLANASRYGTGAVINPTGSIKDGLFEVVIVRRLAFSELMKMIFRPQPFNPKKIEVIQASSVQIRSRHRAHFQVDGEYQGKIRHLEAVAVPAFVKMLLPEANS